MFLLQACSGGVAACLMDSMHAGQTSFSLNSANPSWLPQNTHPGTYGFGKMKGDQFRTYPLPTFLL